MDDAEHTLFICVNWGVKREAIRRAVGAELTPDTMIPLMLQSELASDEHGIIVSRVIYIWDYFYSISYKFSRSMIFMRYARDD